MADLTPVFGATFRLWHCPVHGFMESPRSWSDRGGTPYTCPVNLSTDERGITDDLCDRECAGPFYAVCSGAVDAP